MSQIADEIVREYKMKEYFKKVKEEKEKNKDKNKETNKSYPKTSSMYLQ